MPKRAIGNKEKSPTANRPVVGSVMKAVAAIGSIPTGAKQRLTDPIRA